MSNQPQRTSKIANCEPSRSRQQMADEMFGAPGKVVPSLGKARSSAYVHKVTSDGLKPKTADPGVASGGITAMAPSGRTLTKPATAANTPTPDPNEACTFMDSVINLCRRSIATSGVIGEPVPCEDMFLLLVQLCGISEAKYWAESLGIEYQQSYALLSRLLCGPTTQQSTKRDG